MNSANPTPNGKAVTLDDLVPPVEITENEPPIPHSRWQHDKSPGAGNTMIEKSFSRLSKPPTGTILSSWTVMSKTMIGTGMLALASATAQTGWVLGIMLLCLAGFCALFTLHLLNVMSTSLNTRHVSFYAVAEHVAPRARWVVDFAIALKCLGVGISYLQVAAQMGLSLYKTWVSSSCDKFLVRTVIILASVVVLSPVCYRKRLSRTAVVNALGLVSLLYVAILAVVYAEPGQGHTSMEPVSFLGVLSNLPIFIFTFTCHQNMFMVAEDMKSRTQKKLDIVASLSELTGLLLFVPCLVLPYSTWGQDVQANYMMNLDKALVPVQVGQLMLGLAEVFAYPLQLYPCRKSLMVLITKGQTVSTALERKLRRILTTVILLVAVVVAVFVEDLGITFKVVGIVGSNTICFIMPSFLYCAWFHENRNGKWWASAALCVVSIVLVPVCLFALVYNAVSGGASGGH